MILVLAGWCAGLAAGAALLGSAAAPAALGAALSTAGLAGLVMLTTRSGRRGVALLLGATFLVFGLARGAASVHVPGPASADYYHGRHVTLVGAVVRSSVGPTYQSFWLAGLRMAGRPVAGTVQVTARSPVPVVPGSLLRVTGTLERLPGRAYDGSTGFDDRMERSGVLAAMPGATYQLVAPPGPWALPAMAWRLRNAISAGIRARVPEPEATVLLGEMVGIRGKLPPAIEADLVDSGLVHVLAVSGLKVAIVAGILAALLRRAGRRAALLAIAGVFAFAVVGGASSAALRSAGMGSLALLAQVLRRDVDPPRSLLLAAAVMLGINPELASDLSFQYSFVGVVGIQLLQPSLDARLSLVLPPFREALSVSLAAQLATLPLTAAYFHVVPLVGPLLNTLVLPFLGPTMAAGAWVAVGWPGAGGLVAVLAAGSAAALLQLAHLGAAAPAGVLRVPWFALPHAVGYYCGAAVVVAAMRVGGFPRAMTIATLPVAALVGLLLLTLPDGRLHVVFLDTPGGGVLLRAPDGARMLVDAGASAPALGTALDKLLPPEAPVLDALLLTGSAAGSAAGIAGLGERVPGVVMVAADAPGDVPAGVADALSRHGSAVQTLVVGDELHWHGLDLTLDSCGPGLAVSVRYGRTLSWICDSGALGDPGAVPAGSLAAVDVGDGKVEPGGAVAAGWVVEHRPGVARGGLSAAALGPRLWRTSRDGPLALSCDATRCSR